MTRTSSTRRVAMTAVAALLLASLLPAAADAAWTTPAALATSGTVQFTAGGPDGTIIVAWKQATPVGTQVFGAVKPPGGAWVYLEPLPPDALPTSVAIDPAGNVLTVWTATGSVLAGYLPSGATAWHVTTVATEPVAAGAVVAVDATGLFTAAWVHTPDTSCIVRSATWSAGAAPWTDPASVYPSGECAHLPAIAVNAAGRAVAVWNGPWAAGIYVSGTPQIRAAERPAATAPWTTSVVLAQPARFRHVKYSGITGAVLSPSGAATVVWFAANKVWAATKAPGAASWSKNKAIGSSGSLDYTRLLPETGLAVDARGTIEVFFTLWGYNTGTTKYYTRLKTSVLPAGGTWTGGGTIVSDKTGGNGFGTRIAVDPASSEFALLFSFWNEKTVEYQVQSTYTVASTWLRPAAVLGTTGGTLPAVGLAHAPGVLLAAWTDVSGSVVVSTMSTPAVLAPQ